MTRLSCTSLSVKNLTLTGLPASVSFTSNTSAIGALSNFNSVPIVNNAIPHPFDTQEFFISSSQTSGINQGKGNNEGMLTTNAADAFLGDTEPAYARADAVISSQPGAAVPCPNNTVLKTLLTTTGVSCQAVAETLGGTVPNTGSATGKFLISSSRFSVDTDTNLAISGVLAKAMAGFSSGNLTVQINYRITVNGEQIDDTWALASFSNTEEINYSTLLSATIDGAVAGYTIVITGIANATLFATL